MNKNVLIGFIVINSALISGLYGQNHENEEKNIHSTEYHHQDHKKHVISASINHTIIFEQLKTVLT
jgi:hypothetical protein